MTEVTTLVAVVVSSLVTTDVTVEADCVIVVKEPEIEVVTVTGGIIDVTVEAD